MSEGGYCPHGVNVFDPNGCKKCDSIARGKMRPPYVNGHALPRPPVNMDNYELSSDGKLQRKTD